MSLPPLEEAFTLVLVRVDEAYSSVCISRRYNTHTHAHSKAVLDRRRIRAHSEGWRCDELVWNCHGRWCRAFGRSGALEETKRNAAKGRLALLQCIAGRRHARVHVSPAASIIS